MTHYSLTDLGWSAARLAELQGSEPEFLCRVTSVARDRLFVIGTHGDMMLLPESDRSTGSYAVGDWLIATSDLTRVARLLPRQSELSRRAAGSDARRQLIAANVDTLAIVSSCNADFNSARLERYLALAASADCLPIFVLTKADLASDPQDYVRRAERLSPLASAIALDATDFEEVERLAPWCRDGQTLALLGSSGVGKSTLSNALTGGDLATQDIREDDAKGRHTTTSRGMARTRFGGWLIDTPGMRALRLADQQEGIAQVFDDLEELSRDCRFSDCGHDSEPGCAIQAAITRGELEPDRLHRWQKLRREDARNSALLNETRAEDKAFAKMVRRTIKGKRNRYD